MRRRLTRREDLALRYPGRFAAFATLPVADPQAAASELEWTVAGFKGGLINGVTKGRFLDDPFFMPLLERAEALGVPIYIHPAPPPEPVREVDFSGLEPGLLQFVAQFRMIAICHESIIAQSAPAVFSPH